MQENSLLALALAEMLDDYFKAKPHLTAAALARRSGVTQMTVLRIQKREIRNPTFETVTALLSIVSPEKLPSILNEFFPETMTKIALNREPEMQPMAHDEMSEVLRTTVRFRVFDLASMTSGTSRTEIEREFGRVGLSELDGLVQSGYLRENTVGSVHRSESSSYSNLNKDDLLVQVKARLEAFNLGNIGTEHARLADVSESLTESAVEEIAQLEIEFLQRLLEIKNSLKNKGIIPVHVTYARNLCISVDSVHERKEGRKV